MYTHTQTPAYTHAYLHTGATHTMAEHNPIPRNMVIVVQVLARAAAAISVDPTRPWNGSTIHTQPHTSTHTQASTHIPTAAKVGSTVVLPQMDLA